MLEHHFKFNALSIRRINALFPVPSRVANDDRLGEFEVEIADIPVELQRHDRDIGQVESISGETGETSLTVETALHGSAGPSRSTLFSGYEGALRVPFAIRWPGRIEEGRVSDEIMHEIDLFPTLARIAGGKVPEDRIIDGVDVSDFLLGRNDESGRDGFVVLASARFYLPSRRTDNATWSFQDWVHHC